jgi:hypothetical protein
MGSTQSVSESLYQAIKITDDDPSGVPPSVAKFDDGSMIKTTVKE